MMLIKAMIALAFPCTIYAEYRPIPKDIELRPVQKVLLITEEEVQSSIDLSKINSSSLKEPVTFDTLEKSLIEVERIITSMKEQISYIRFNKR